MPLRGRSFQYEESEAPSREGTGTRMIGKLPIGCRNSPGIPLLRKRGPAGVRPHPRCRDDDPLWTKPTRSIGPGQGVCCPGSRQGKAQENHGTSFSSVFKLLTLATTTRGDYSAGLDEVTEELGSLRATEATLQKRQATTYRIRVNRG